MDFVIFGSGIDLLRSGNVHRDLVDSLVSQRVRFNWCMKMIETIECGTGKAVEICPQAVKVAAGVAQILALTEKSFTLVRP